jgi:hypothetical protein
MQGHTTIKKYSRSKVIQFVSGALPPKNLTTDTPTDFAVRAGGQANHKK